MSVIVNPKKPAQPQTEGKMTAKRAAAEMGTFVDPRDSTEYKTCKIGNQVWLAENLKFELNSDDCVAYDDDYQYFDKYGYLYNEKRLRRSDSRRLALADKKGMGNDDPLRQKRFPLQGRFERSRFGGMDRVKFQQVRFFHGRWRNAL